MYENTFQSISVVTMISMEVERIFADSLPMVSASVASFYNDTRKKQAEYDNGCHVPCLCSQWIWNTTIVGNQAFAFEGTFGGFPWVQVSARIATGSMTLGCIKVYDPQTTRPLRSSSEPPSVTPIPVIGTRYPRLISTKGKSRVSP